MTKIKKVIGLEIFDSRGLPTVAASVELTSGVKATALVPSGASTGSHEAHELRDHTSRYSGKGVAKAVSNINGPINKLLKNKDVTELIDIDYDLCLLDGTKNKSKIGANAILAVSLACARVGAYNSKQPLFKYLQSIYNFDKKISFPKPTMNVLNGGRHADNKLEIQEFMLVPQARSFTNRMRQGVEVYHILKKLLIKNKLSTGLGDEGGFAPRLKSNEQALQLLVQAIKKAGYTPGKDIKLAMDIAASEFYTSGKYQFEGKKLSADKLIEIYKSWIKKYPLVFIEDGLAEDDWQGWQTMNKEIGKKVILVGDDLLVTNYQRLKKCIDIKAANAILIKVNQIGSISETMATIKLAQQNKYKVIVSHRSGETTDDFIADLAIAVGADYIKAGAPARSERLAKYNRLLAIESKYFKK